MICEKCNNQNDALSAKCINCGYDFTQKSIKKMEAEINNDMAKNVIIWLSIALSVWIFQSYKHLFFENYFDGINWYQVAGAAIFGGCWGFIGKKIGDFLYKK